VNGQSQPVDHPDWRQILLMGEQLMAQPTVIAQRETIAETAARLVGGQADLWLAESFRRLPGSDQSALFLVAPPSELMRRALATGQTCHQASPAAVAVPLLVHSTSLGVLQVQRPAGDPSFSDTDIQLLEGVAILASVALRAARQVAIERWQVEQLALVDKVSAQVASIVGLDALCRRVTELILQTFNYYFVALFTLETGQETLRFRASAGPIRSQLDHEKASLALEIRLGRGIIGHVARDGAEIVANDVTREPRYQHYNLLPETRSEVALPLKIEDRVLGVLDVQSDQPDDFTETDMLVLRALANNIAVAVEDARLYSDLEHRAEQLAAVAEVSRAVASILDLDALLNEVVTLIRKRFGYPFVHLFIVQPAREQVVYRAGSGRRARTLQKRGLAYRLDDPQGIIPWVVRNAQTVLANDVSQDPRYRPSELPPSKTCAELAVPLTFGGQVLGVLDVQSDRCHAFSDGDRSLFEALAGNVAVAIRNANLYRSERWRRQVADSLREVAGLLSTDLALDQVLDATLTELEHILPCDVAAIWLLREDNASNSPEPYLCLGAVHGYAAGQIGCADDLSPEGGRWLMEMLHADQPIARMPESPSDPLGAALGFPSDHSAIVAPLRAGDRRLGLLTLAHRDPERYGGEARTMVSAFASYAAVAIENARLYQAAQEQAYVSTVLLQAAEAVQSLNTLDDVLQAVVRLMPMVVGVERCLVFLWDETAEVFTPAAAYGLSPTQRAAFDESCIGPGDVPALGQLRLVKSLTVVRDVAGDPLVAETIISAFGFESLLLLPLLARGEVLGAMLVDYQNEQPGDLRQGKLGGERMAIIRGIAYQTATAVENARLLEARQEEAYVSAALLQVAQAVVSFNELDDILSAIVRITPILIGVERCIIFLWDAERSVFRPASAYGVPDRGEGALLARRYAPGDFPLLDAVRERDSLMIYPAVEGFRREGMRLETPAGDDLVPADFSADFAECPPDAAYPPGRQCSLLAVPLSVKGDVLGVMLVEEAPAARRFYERRLEIIAGIAQQVAMAVQNDRLQQETAGRERLERELQLAREIQLTFMPSQLPHLPGWEMAVMCQPARQVGGDFYDLFELPGGRLGLVIADVADKGMPAALFMALTRALVRAAALEEESPAAALVRVNDLLVPDAQHGMFVTAIYAVLTLETGQLIYANAGHNPPLWLQACGQTLERLVRGGMALGVLEGVKMEERSITLEPCDCLTFYTDGITDAFSPQGDLYGEERLRQMIQSSNADSAQAMLNAIEASVTAFAGDNPPSDDMTLMVLRRLEHPK
jgi:sigma-B regulation protein RsbU (phosphoserine phosphatase)